MSILHSPFYILHSDIHREAGVSASAIKSGLTAAYGGEAWSPRETGREDFVAAWGDWGVSSECGTLRAVLLKRPGPELDLIDDYDAAQMRAPLDAARARAQHDGLAAAYEAHGVAVHRVEGSRPDKPNALFCRDLMLMTPAGAIIARPASTVRAGEERYVAEALGRLGVPILMTVHGEGTFEGADVSWVNKDLCFLAEGLRTNRAGADQVEWALRSLGTEVVRVQLPYGAMHLDGLLNFPDRDLAVIWPRRTPFPVWRTLKERGFRFVLVEDEVEAQECLPMNFVALAPGKILLPAGGRRLKSRYQEAGIETVEVEVDELIKAGGGIHCMTAFLRREEV
jgi:N-dimethylarginine dimethylaminohydrolase